ncbi:DUF488 family protein, N3 subclade [Peribacillus asahii]|uniref:DUF488 family protein, N3 subclade n=1 Tax=Peribacillus asahii TaxID=228899 RepID=UPI00207925DB|nr:DUF488 family protein [Peribacillus asahii]USK72665.1 DUF488 domain-containing protein [Peribacillus asahii]
MEIYTSNYASINKFPEGYRPIAISVGPPKWFNGPVDKRLAPSWAMMKKPRAEYDRLFAEQLNKLDAKKIASELPDKAVLLCYEAHNDWCHRRMVAEWLEKELDIVVPEFGFDREQTFPYSECCEANKGKVRVPKKKEQTKEPEPQPQPEKPYGYKLTIEEWRKSGIGCTRPDLFDVGQLPAVKARRASMAADNGLNLGVES